MPEKPLLIKNGHVVDPAAQLDGEFDVLLAEGRVAEIAPAGRLRAEAQVIEARGLVVAPGFIDIHVHLREPGQSHKETIATGTSAAAAGGFTSVCAMPNTYPVNDSAEITAWMRAPERGAQVNVFPIAAASVGSAGQQLTDFRALVRAGAVAVTDDGKPILDDQLMRAALVEARRHNIPVVQHAEDTRLTAGCSMNAGPTAFRLGLRGMPAAAETKIVERDIRLAAETGAHLHVAHISTAGALDAVRRAKRAGARVTCEVTPHHFVLTDEVLAAEQAAYNANFKMNPPLRSAADRAAMLAGLADGTIDTIATDHAPHARDEKRQEFDRAPFGIIGLETALGLTLLHLHRNAKLPLERIVSLLSTGPARVMNLKDRGTFARNAHADVTIFDPKTQWRYDVRASASKSRNTPFNGHPMLGRVVYTIVGGKIVYRAKR